MSRYATTGRSDLSGLDTLAFLTKSSGFHSLKTIFRGALICVGVFVTLAALFLFSLRDRRPEIYFAAATGNTNSIADYLRSGADVNAPIIAHPFGYQYAPLLDIAVEHGQTGTVKFLLANGASPNALDSRGESPLYWAVGTGTNTVRLQILCTLLKAGANPNFKSRSSEAWTPLMLAADLSEPEMVRLILLDGANVNMTNAAGQTALILAHDPEVTNLLVKAGAR